MQTSWSSCVFNIFGHIWFFPKVVFAGEFPAFGTFPAGVKALVKLGDQTPHSDDPRRNLRNWAIRFKQNAGSGAPKDELQLLSCFFFFYLFNELF